MKNRISLLQVEEGIQGFVFLFGFPIIWQYQKEE